MKINITSIEAARNYEQILHFIRRAGQGTAVRKYADDIKRGLRDFYHRANGPVKWLKADYDGGFEVISLTAKTEEEAEDEFNDRYRYIYTPSQYDCTGKPFTLSHKLFKRGGRWMAYHHYAIDV